MNAIHLYALAQPHDGAMWWILLIGLIIVSCPGLMDRSGIWPAREYDRVSWLAMRRISKTWRGRR